MGDTPINNGKDRLKKVYPGLDDKEVQEIKNKGKEQLREVIKEYPEIQKEFEKILSKKSTNNREMNEWPSKRGRGQPPKNVEFFLNELLKLLECKDIDEILIYKDMLFDNLKWRIRNCKGCTEDEFKDMLKRFIKESIEVLKEERCEQNVEDVEELKEELLEKVGKMDERTIKKNFHNLFKGLMKWEVETMIRARKHITDPKGYSQYNMAIGRIAERIMLWKFVRLLKQNGDNYIVFPYFEKHEGLGKVKKSKSGTKSKGQHYVDIVVINVSNRVIGIVELKNWPGEGIYSEDDYENKNKDAEKWGNTEKDIKELLRFLFDVSIKNKKKPKSLGLKIFEESIGLINSQRTKENLEQLMKNGLIKGLERKEFTEKEISETWRKLFETIEIIDMMSRGKMCEEEVADIFNLTEYHLMEFNEQVFVHDVNSYKFMKFFVTFTGVPIDNGDIKGGRELDNEILEKFKEEGIIHIEVKPALIDVLDRKYWRIAEFVAQLILKIMNNRIKVDKEIKNVLINRMKEESGMVVFEFSSSNDIEPRCKGMIRIPKWIWEKING